MNKNYLKLQVNNISSEQSEMLIAQLSELGFDGFEENENRLSAFIGEELIDKDQVRTVFDTMNLSYTTEVIPETNWNESWEKNFDPVIVEDFAAVRAHFHEPIKHVQHEIIITPKMSFGTGHHATTYMMMQQMREINFIDKTVFDFGTGTGILSILAEKLGAIQVYAIDNDEWSIENAKENIEKNNCTRIKIELADTPDTSRQFDLILANINKHVILEHLENLTNSLNKDGLMLVSGLVIDDENDIQQAVSNLRIKHLKTASRDKWLCIIFTA